MMEENKLLEKLWREAQSVEVPPELLPEQIRVRIEAEGKVDGAVIDRDGVCKDSADHEHQKKSHRHPGRRDTEASAKKRSFHWHGFGGRAVAAAIVLVASLGAYGVAQDQDFVPVGESAMVADDGMEQKAPVQIAHNGQNAQDPQTDAADAAANTDSIEVVRTLGDYRMADSYEEVCDMLNELKDARKYYFAGAYKAMDAADGVAAESEMVKEEAAEDREESASSGAFMDMSGDPSDTSANKQNQQLADSTDYSTTNLQVTGVDESDIVKTDGHYIYIATNDKVQIVDASTETPRQLGSITPELSGNMDHIREMYVSDGRLLLIVQTEDTDGFVQSADDAGGSGIVDLAYDVAYDPIFANNVHTQILTYDITVPAGAKLVGTFTQDGSYNSSRKIGDQVYLFTDYGFSLPWPYYRPYLDGRQKEASQEEQEETELTKEDVKNKLPKIQGETIPENSIYLPKDGTEHGVLIAAVDVKEPEQATDQKLIFCGYSTLHVTKDSILLYCTDYDEANNRERTKLTKFAIGDGRITAKCAEAVPGYVGDMFAIHENADGYVYILTTAYTANGTTNQLYVLDENLKIHGKIEHIADGETVYAARFVDEIGYFVTYRNMDPLFTVDFSDPANPTLIGELEIPGFSDYLQFWDDTHLIGVGEERKEKDSEFIGIKVSLYDISDPTHVTESAKLVLDDAYYAPAEYNYKALLADSRKNVIAFLTADQGENNQASQRILTVKDGALKLAASDRISSDENGYYALENYRNLYIGDRLYLVREGLVVVYDMEHDFARIATCKLN